VDVNFIQGEVVEWRSADLLGTMATTCICGMQIGEWPWEWTRG